MTFGCTLLRVVEIRAIQRKTRLSWISDYLQDGSRSWSGHTQAPHLPRNMCFLLNECFLCPNPTTWASVNKETIENYNFTDIRFSRFYWVGRGICETIESHLPMLLQRIPKENNYTRADNIRWPSGRYCWNPKIAWNIEKTWIFEIMR